MARGGPSALLRVQETTSPSVIAVAKQLVPRPLRAGKRLTEIPAGVPLEALDLRQAKKPFETPQDVRLALLAKVNHKLRFVTALAEAKERSQNRLAPLPRDLQRAANAELFGRRFLRELRTRKKVFVAMGCAICYGRALDAASFPASSHLPLALP